MKVSAIMPTYDRRALIPVALRCYMQQDWPDMELVVLDDGTDPINDLLVGVPNVTYMRHEGGKLSIGAKRNLCCEAATGEIICHSDDDDWSAPGRVNNQVTRLVGSGKGVTGYHSIYYWSDLLGRAYLYNQSGANYAVGTSLCYWRDWWADHRFPDKTYAEDNHFVYAARNARQLIAVPADQIGTKGHK